MRLFLLLLLSALICPAQTVDQTIALGVRHGELRFDKELITAKPDTSIKIVFTNNDEMPHNVVICKPGTDTKAIGEAALKLGDKGLAMHYVPKSDKILASTPLVEPAATHEFLFKVPGAKSAEYPFVCTFPGHYLLMVGVIRVGDSGRIANLAYKYYEGSWEKLPDFSQLEAKKEGTLPNGLISLKAASRKDNFGFVFTGRLDVPKEGNYTFNMGSDDGMRVQIDGKTVVEHDGIHGVVPQQGKVTLEAGVRQITVSYFENAGGEALSLKWSGPGFNNRQLSESKAPSGGGNGDFIVEIDKTPYVYRTGLSVPGISKGAYSIAVGMPGGINYCFDAEHCFLRAAWSGGFIDAQADWNRRGGSGAKAIGDVFYTNEAQFPIGIAGVDAAPDFRGYELKDGYPIFEYRLGEAVVRASVRPNGDNSGLVQAFEISGASGQIAYAAPGHEKTYAAAPAVSFEVEVAK
jgi:azurin